jgi:hypothetical protein
MFVFTLRFLLPADAGKPRLSEFGGQGRTGPQELSRADSRIERAPVARAIYRARSGFPGMGIVRGSGDFGTDPAREALAPRILNT